MLGHRGLDVNDPAQKYQLRSLPGKFSGLHMVCMMYVGFTIVAPEHDIGLISQKSMRWQKLCRQAATNRKPSFSSSTPPISIMLIYSATKNRFRDDVLGNRIEACIYEAFKDRLGRSTTRAKSTSWAN